MTANDSQYFGNEAAEWHPGMPDRRKAQRRSGTDRRDMIRFEPEKLDRRSGRDRRQQG
jgi:hypothetical protein